MSKEEAIEILSEMRSEYNLFGDEEEATRYHVLSWAIKAINAEAVKHGKWEKVKYDDDDGYFYLYVHKDCGCEQARERNYCPNCGAKMDGGEE